MWAPLLPKAPTSEIETGLYTEAFAAVLAEHGRPAPMSAPVEARRTVRVRRGLGSDDARHLPALRAGGLGWLLLFSIGAALWYSIVDPVWSIPRTIPSPIAIAPLIRHSAPRFWAIESETLLIEADQAAAAADERVFAIDPTLPRPSEIAVETAALSTQATVPPSQTTHRPAPDLIASFVETTPNPPTSSHRSPKDTISVRPGDDLEKPVTGRNGEAKGAIGNPFVDLYPEQPQSVGPSITTASGVGPGASQSENPQPDSSADAPDAEGNATSHTGPQEGKGPKAGKDKPSAAKEKPSAGKSVPAGPQDNHNSSGGKPSPGKPDQNRKSDADKKDKPGKDKGDKAKGKGPH